MRYDVAVIGLGLVGAAALRHVSAQGSRAVGIGPGEPDSFAEHGGAFASHYDSGRITRVLDAEFEWALLARRSIAEYALVAEQSGICFHRPVGLLYATESEHHAAQLNAVAARLGVDHRQLTHSPDPRVSCAAARHWFVEAGPAGHIDPRRLVFAQLAAAERQGASVIRSEVREVRSVVGGFEIDVKSTTDDHSANDERVERVFADRVVFALGPHSGEVGVSPAGALDVHAETIVTGVLDDEEHARLRGLPSIIAPIGLGRYDGAYVVPPTDYPDGTTRIKLGNGLLAAPRLVDAGSRRAWMRSDEHTQQLGELRGQMEELIPGIRAIRWETKPCLITATATKRPFITLPMPGAVAFAGCNGYAAKSSDALGALLAGLAINETWTDPDLDPLRFAPPNAVNTWETT